VQKEANYITLASLINDQLRPNRIIGARLGTSGVRVQEYTNEEDVFSFGHEEIPEKNARTAQRKKRFRRKKQSQGHNKQSNFHNAFETYTPIEVLK